MTFMTPCRRCHKKVILADERGTFGSKTCAPCREYERLHRPEKEARYKASGKRKATNARNNPRNNYARIVHPTNWLRRCYGFELFNRVVGYAAVDSKTGAINL
jgi:hypothetical protein